MEAFSFSSNCSPVVLGVPSAATPAGPGGPGGLGRPGGPGLPEGPGRPLCPWGPCVEGGFDSWERSPDELEDPDEGLLLGRFWWACMKAWLH